VVEFCWLPHQQLVVNLVPHWNRLVALHYLQQNLVSVLVSEQLNNCLRCQSLLQSVETLLFHPVTADTFVHHTGTVLLDCELRESFSNHFSNTGAFILSEKFITKLNDVIAKCVLDDLIDTESDFVDELLFGLRCQLFDLFRWVISLQLRNEFHHVFDNTHGVLVKCKIQEVFLGELKKWVSVYNGEQANDFLDEMGGVGMT
jgi:hypothetical protein